MKRVRVIIKRDDVNVHTYLTIYRHEIEIQIRVQKRQLMKRRINNVDYYFYNNVRVIERVKRDKFNRAL